MKLAAFFAFAAIASAQYVPAGPVFPHASTATTSYVQGCVSSAGAASVTCALGSITAGNKLLVISKNSSVFGPALTVGSSAGVSCSWTTLRAALDASTSYSYGIAYCDIPSSGAETVQVSWTGSGNTGFADIAVAEYSSSTGFVAGSDGFNFFSAPSSTTTCSSGSITTTGTDAVVGACLSWNAANTWGAVGGYTQRATSSRNTTGWYDASPAAGSQSFSATVASDTVTGLIVGFKAN
jgi:hypothetical protein